MGCMECLKGTYAIVDTETTGTSANYGGIIEIGILRVEDGTVVKKYQTRVKSERQGGDCLARMEASLEGYTEYVGSLVVSHYY